jgi:hypothetical protein
LYASGVFTGSDLSISKRKTNYMKKMYTSLLCLWAGLPFAVFAQSPGGTSMLQSQFINPCGNDGRNEFIISTTGNSAVNIQDFALASIDPNTGTQPNFNFYWRGSRVAQEPNPTFTTNSEACNTAGLECYGIADPGVPAEATVINARISTLNAVAGCTVFLPVPADGNIPANSLFVFFLGAYYCDFDNLSTSLNFSNHCSSGVQYYAVFGFGDGGATSSLPCTNPVGYFSNTLERTSMTFVYTGGTGGNTNPANYTTNAVNYTPGADPASGNAGWINPIGSWINDQGCIPSAFQLPIQLVDFTGSRVGNTIVLKWQTASEENNAYLEIERSKDGVQFVAMKQIKGHGTTSEPRFYTWTDEHPLPGINYYRLKQVDVDGKTEYYRVLVLEFKGKTAIAALHLYPTQTADRLVIALDTPLAAEATLQVADLMGRVLEQQQLVVGTVQQELSVQHLPQGQYLISFQSSDQVQTARFFKL